MLTVVMHLFGSSASDYFVKNILVIHIHTNSYLQQVYIVANIHTIYDVYSPHTAIPMRLSISVHIYNIIIFGFVMCTLHTSKRGGTG